MKRFFSLFIGALFLLAACKPSQEDQIDKAWTMLNMAANSPEIELSIPLGFELNCTEDEYNAKIQELINTNSSKGYVTIYADLFNDGTKYDLYVSNFPYFSDPNTQTDTIAQISFIFEESRTNKDQSYYELIKNKVDKQFDENWQRANFKLEENSYFREESSHFWIKDNIAVRLQSTYSYIQLSFYNMPKYGVKFFQDEVERDLRIKKEVEEEFSNKKSYPVQNSAWDGSVWQAKKYIKSQLKDPDSYESIEWSNVVKNDNGYCVRHKFRAKNSFGAYTVEEYIIYLNEKGTVTYSERTL